MKPRIGLGAVQSLVVMLIMLWIWGGNLACNSGPRTHAYIETLNAEKRGLEDRIYALEYDLDILEEELAEAREQLKQKGVVEQDRPSLPGRRPPAARSPALTPKRSLPGELEHPRIEIEAPEIEEGTPLKNAPPKGLPKLNRAQAERQSVTEHRGRAEQLPTANDDKSVDPIVDPNDTITQLYVNSQLTGSADFDGKPGDDGILVVIEPRNAAGEYVPVAGPVSIVLLDPAQAGDAARIARWDLDTVEASRFVKNSEIAQGLQLQLPWPEAPPANPRLRLFARYTSPQGSELQTEQDIFVSHADPSSPRWSPRARAAVGPPSRTVGSELDPQARRPRAWRAER